MQALQRYAHLLILPPVFALDRWTKYMIETRIQSGEGFSVFSWLAIVNGHNTGGLFGLMAHHSVGRWIFLVLPLFIIAGLFVYLTVYRLPLWGRLSLSFVLSGAVGNMYDRLLYGYVVDFIDVTYWAPLHWPAFNVADSAITFGIGLWLFSQIVLKEGTGKTEAKGR
jgi:signal peptidase II